MSAKREIILSTITGWKISPEVWLEWLTENGLRQIDFYGCSPEYSPFAYKKGNGYRERKLEEWRKTFEERKIQVFSYTPEMRNYPLNLADSNEEVRRQTVLYCENAIRDAALLGAPHVRLCAGYGYLGAPRTLAWEQMCRSFEKLVPVAEREGVCILTGPDDWNVTDVIDGCEHTVSLFEKFPSGCMKVFLPSVFLTEKGESAAWYENTMGERMGALGIRGDCGALDAVPGQIGAMESLSRDLPLVLELSGENNADTYLSSVRNGFAFAGEYGREKEYREVKAGYESEKTNDAGKKKGKDGF